MKIKALLIVRQERRQPLLEQLQASGVAVLPAGCCQEARHILETRPAIDVVLTGATLPDGDWRTVLEAVVQSHTRAEVVVCPRLADVELWCEALERGAYDLLVEPFQPQEVQRIVGAAAERGRRQHCGDDQTAG